MRRIVGVLAAVSLTVPLAACSAVDQAASDAKNAATCAAVEGISAELSAVVERATTGATAQELKQQAQALRITAEGLAATLGSLSPEVTAALEKAAQTFDAAVAEVPADATAAAAKQTVSDASTALRQSIDDAKASLGC